jgi:isoamylase
MAAEGSADVYSDDGRSAYNSINFVTCHDGFTLHDLVSYDQKHNELNQESNTDGSNDNNSWNCGVEGETSDAAVLELRSQMMRNYACLLLFSSGTPMILGGDEFARTQRGNNNAYCQDNAVGWFDWEQVERNTDLFEFFQKAIAFVRRFPVLQRRRFALGTDLDADGLPDLAWFGTDLGDPRWNDPESRTLCVQMDTGGDAVSQAQRLFFILNAHFENRRVALPPLPAPVAWHRAIDTSLPAGEDISGAGSEVRLDPTGFYIANARSTVVLLAQ